MLLWNCVLIADIIKVECCLNQEGFTTTRGSEDEEDVEICVLKEFF